MACACGRKFYLVRPDVQTWLWTMTDLDEQHYWRHVYLSLAARMQYRIP